MVTKQRQCATYLVETRSRCCGGSWWTPSLDWACSVLKKVQRSAACPLRLEWRATASCDCVWLHPNRTVLVPHSPAWSWWSHPAHTHMSCGHQVIVKIQNTALWNLKKNTHTKKKKTVWRYMFHSNAFKCNWIKDKERKAHPRTDSTSQCWANARISGMTFSSCRRFRPQFEEPMLPWKNKKTKRKTTTIKPMSLYYH